MLQVSCPFWMWRLRSMSMAQWTGNYTRNQQIKASPWTIDLIIRVPPNLLSQQMNSTEPCGVHRKNMWKTQCKQHAKTNSEWLPSACARSQLCPCNEKGKGGKEKEWWKSEEKDPYLDSENSIRLGPDKPSNSENTSKTRRSRSCR